MKFFGVASNSPEHVINLLQQDKKRPKYHLIPIGGTVRSTAAVAADVLLFLTPTDLSKNLTLVNHSKLQGKLGILFASPVRLADFTGIDVIDCPKHAACTWTFTKLKPSDIRGVLTSTWEDQQVGISKADFLTQLIDNSLEGSFLSPFMTLVYQFPASIQRAIQVKVFKWMTVGGDKSELKKLWASFRSMPKDKAVQLESLLDSDAAKCVLAALADIARRKATNKPVSYKDLTKKFGASRYELKYIDSILVKAGGSANLEQKTLTEIFYGRQRNAASKRDSVATEKPKTRVGLRRPRKR